MENSLKQRIVGAVVLIALAVIFLPAILKEKEQQEPFISKIPPKPIETIPQELPADVVAKNKKVQDSLDQLEKSARKTKIESEEVKVDLNQEKNLTESIADKSTKLQSADITKTEVESQKEIVPKGTSTQETIETIGTEFQEAAWIIQIASFSNKENAVSFVDKLKKAGHKTYRQDITTDKNKTIYRVYTGPYIRKEEAVKALKDVNEVSKLNGIIMVFDPTKL